MWSAYASTVQKYTVNTRSNITCSYWDHTALPKDRYANTIREADLPTIITWCNHMVIVAGHDSRCKQFQDRSEKFFDASLNMRWALVPSAWIWAGLLPALYAAEVTPMWFWSLGHKRPCSFHLAPSGCSFWERPECPETAGPADSTPNHSSTS